MTSLTRLLSFLLFLLALAPPAQAVLPRRLLLLIDGVAYRDVVALQQGVSVAGPNGKPVYRQAFTNGYFPVSRLVSTFPSTSDIAWTEMLGNTPLPGYQRTYYSRAANASVRQNGVTSTMPYEQQMSWQEQNGFRRASAYVATLQTFRAEVRAMTNAFLQDHSGQPEFYALIRTTDCSQHLGRDIRGMLCDLDQKLEALRLQYRRAEGRELELVLLSDHGNNHVPEGRRVPIRPFLKRAGYRISSSINSRADVVLPTVGVESWVELHAHPSETLPLFRRLAKLDGVDIITCRLPDRPNQFLVSDRHGAQASILYNPQANSFAYRLDDGDPLSYRNVLQKLESTHQLDPLGFAPGDVWMQATLKHRYPLALERIVHAHTRAALNFASVLISLDNRYVHASWLVKSASELVTLGGTHGGLDDLNSVGALLTTFRPTPDTSMSRVFELFDNFPGLRDFRALDPGAEFVSPQTVPRIPRSPHDPATEFISPAPITKIARPRLNPLAQLTVHKEVIKLTGAPHQPNVQSIAPKPVTRTTNPSGATFSSNLTLRVWGPNFRRTLAEPRLVVRMVPCRFLPPTTRRGDPTPDRSIQICLQPTATPSLSERLYAFPPHLTLNPSEEYRMDGWLSGNDRLLRAFRLSFRTDSFGKPVPF